MALGSTMYNFAINLADADRALYESLEIRAAKHPSETEEFLLTRILAWCIELQEGLCFSKGGVSDRDEPTLYAKDLSGVMTLWVEIGAPSPERLHQASKASPRVVVYCHKDIKLLNRLKGEGIHRAEFIEFKVLDGDFVKALAQRLERRMSLSLTISEGHLYCSVGDEAFDCQPEAFSLSSE